MFPDPDHCFDCDRRLDDPPTDGRALPRCAECQADIDVYAAARGGLESGPPRFRGVIALGAALPGWPTKITLLTLGVWDRFSELDLLEDPGADPPESHPRVEDSPLGEQPPRKWIITTDLGTVHHDGAGGGGSGAGRLQAWHATIAPSIPEHAGRLDVVARGPGATARTTIDLSARPLTRRTAEIEHIDTPADTEPSCPSCGVPSLAAATAPPDGGPGLELDWAMTRPPAPDPYACIVRDRRPLCAACASALQTVLAAKVLTHPSPDSVIALGAELGPLFGSEVVIPALVTWPTWFDLAIVGHTRGAWAELTEASRRAIGWTARDNLGHDYVGASTGGRSSPDLAWRNLSFVPALAPDATTLTVTLPASIDGRVHEATIDLAPSTRGSSTA
jgi:hypothetical protein